MPWDASTFKSRHNHGLSGAQAGKAASIANAILRRTGDEGLAIRTANARAKGYDDGGVVPDRDGGGGVGAPGSSGNPYPYETPDLLNYNPLKITDQEAAAAEGGVIGRAPGGGITPFKPPRMYPPFFQRQAMRQLHTGPVLSAVPGRTDAHKIKVPSGSYVLPAETISGMGDGNSMAGLKRAHEMFGMGPYGTALRGMPHARSAFPKAPNLPTHFAYGGYSEGGSREGDHFHPVDVDVSGGEYIIHPAAIIARWGSLKRGHQVLDAFVMDRRKKHIKTLKNLPGPAKR